MIEWCIAGFGIGKSEFLRFSKNVPDLVKLNSAVFVHDIEAKEGRYRSVISEFESFAELVDASLVVLRFSNHLEIVDVHRNEDASFSRIKRALVCLTLRKTEIQ